MKKPCLSSVSEIQGLYGPLQILESSIQKIWALQHLQPGDWRTRTGERISVRAPGRWNRSAGPDFKEAVIELDKRTLVGDVEIHLYREDWWRHGHAVDPGYNEVILHVVLFAGGMEHAITTERGFNPYEWQIGPWIREDIEAISGGSPGLFGEMVPELKEWMESDGAENIRERLLAGADRRWLDKVSMARCLIDDHGWEGALHRMTLYYLGYPLNRRAFFQMAEFLPLQCWREQSTLEAVKQKWEQGLRWRSGRPANRPLRRLQQYIALNRASPNWTQRLKAVPPALRDNLLTPPKQSREAWETRKYRRHAGLSEWQEWLSRQVLKNQFNRNLIMRLWIDVYLPVLSAAEIISDEEAGTLWFHSHAAAFPECYRDLLQLVLIGGDKRYALNNGWIQGVIWLEDQMRIERVRSAMGKNSVVCEGSGA